MPHEYDMRNWHIILPNTENLPMILHVHYNRWLSFDKALHYLKTKRNLDIQMINKGNTKVVLHGDSCMHSKGILLKDLSKFKNIF